MLKVMLGWDFHFSLGLSWESTVCGIRDTKVKVFVLMECKAHKGLGIWLSGRARA